MVKEHIVTAYDQELARLSDLISRMGGLAESQIAQAIEALSSRDSAAAEQVIEGDRKIDALEADVHEFALRLLALRQPMALDLRQIVAAIRIAPDIERIGDYAKNVAKRTIALNQIPPVQPVFTVPRMAQLVQQMIKDVLDAFAAGDVAKAYDVWRRDAEVDAIYDSLFRELLTYMMEDTRNITACTHLVFIAKNVERMGDLATNIAETINFQVTGEMLDEMRPKSDYASLTVVAPEAGDQGGTAS